MSRLEGIRDKFVGGSKFTRLDDLVFDTKTPKNY
jgi:hypothetical protein